MTLDPTTIGRYKVLGTLGQGAMGVVYLGEDPLLKRGVAIKVVQAAGFRMVEALLRFQREAEISARLNHPNLITVFDVGEDPTLGPFLTMEYVDGEGLDARVARGPLPLVEALDLLLQAMDGLEAAHGAGITHRDLKPGNFLVGRDGRLRITDFGIARGDDGQATSTAGFLGSPAYAAPELLRSEPASAATDRWAFAVSAYQLFTGELPFAGAHVSDLLYAIAHGEPAFRADLAPEVIRVFALALAKDPSSRPQTLRAFMEALLAAVELAPEDRARLEARLGKVPVPAMGSRPRFKPIWLWGGLGAAVLAWAVLRPGGQRVVSLASDPPGAQVLVDGKPLGRTPLRDVSIPKRASTLRFELPERTPVDHALKPGDRLVKVRLDPAPYAINVITDPPGAEVRLDDKVVGRSPLRGLQVPGEGHPKLQLQLKGYRTQVIPLDRHRVLPEPIRLAKGADEANPVKKLWKGLFN